MSKQKIINIYSLPYKFGSEWIAYLVFSIIFIPIGISSIFIALEDPEAYLFALFSVFLSVGFLFFIGSFKVEIREYRVIYKTLFSKQEIPIEEIQRLDMIITTVQNVPAYYLNMISHDEKLSINMKPFSKKDLAILIDLVATKNNKIELNELATELREGKYSKINNESIRKVFQMVISILATWLLAWIIKWFLWI